MTGLLKRYGFRGLVLKTIERMQSPMLAYSNKYMQYMPTEEELKKQRESLPKYAPLVSIVIPTYETPENYLRELIDSLLVQSYPNWELCLADGSKTDGVSRVAEKYQKADKRIRYQKLEKNGGISENTNGGFAMVKGEFVALMDHDDLLTPNALYEMVNALNTQYTVDERTMAMIYSDEDKINGDGTVHSRPHFKPGYNPQFLYHNNYFCHFLLFSAKLLEQTKGLKKEYDGAQDYDFVLRCVEAGAIVRHVPKILYHWRIHEGSTAGNSADKAYAFDNGCRAIEAHLNRIGESAKARVTTNLGVYQVTYDLKGIYRIVIAAEKEEHLHQIQSWYGTSYHKDDYIFELTYSKVKQLDNHVMESAEGDYIFYLTKDIILKDKNILETMLRYLQHEKTAVVGSKILDTRKQVASCGYIYRQDGEILPAFKGLRAEFKGYFLHAVIPQNVSVVDFSCVMLKKLAWEKTAGFSEEFVELYKAADYCFQVDNAGFEVVVTPESTVVSRKKQSKTDSPEEFYHRWKEKLKQPDGCYNPNLTLEYKDSYRMKE